MNDKQTGPSNEDINEALDMLAEEFTAMGATEVKVMHLPTKKPNRVRIDARLPQEQVEWLKSQPEGLTATLESLIYHEILRRNQPPNPYTV